MTDDRAEYKLVNAHAIAEAFSHQGSTRVEYQLIGDSQTIDMPYAGFGDRAHEIVDDPTEMDAPDRDSYVADSPVAFMIRDCVVRTQYGLITVADMVVRESTFTFPAFLFPQFVFSGPRCREVSVSLPPTAPSVSIPYAICAQAGIHDNYYHWMILFLGRIVDAAVANRWDGEFAAKPILLFPFFVNRVQRDSAAAIAAHFRLPMLCVEQPVSLAVDALVFPIPTPSSGLKPHPVNRRAFQILKQEFHRPDAEMPDKIYISRRDTSHREIVNEKELEEFLIRQGYAIIRLDGRSVAEQVNIFAHAREVIGPHGAGLTNIGYCAPGTVLLELHMPSHLNWCYRRLAAVCGLRYGFILGELVKNHEDINGRKYKIDLLAVNEAINGGHF